MMDTSGYVKKLLGWLEQGWFFLRNQRKVPLLTNMLAAVFSLVVIFSMLQGRGDHLSSLEPEKHPGAHKQAGTVTEVKPPVPFGDELDAMSAAPEDPDLESENQIDEQQETMEPAVDTWSRTKWLGDYKDMVKRRQIRALVPHSKTFFFLDKGKKRGLTYETMMEFEKFLNKKLKTRPPKLNVIVIPTPRNKLLQDLQDGYGDIAAGNLTITANREKLVDFTNPGMSGVSEIVVTGPGEPELSSVFDLSGREVFVRKSSSYYESLIGLNKTLQSVGKKQVQIIPADEYLEDEDLLEMVNAGLVPIIVIDSHKAQFWGKIFKKITLHPKIKLRHEGDIAWAIRKDNPQLKKVINEFVSTIKKGSLTGNILYKRYLEDTGYIKNSLSDKEIAKFNRTIDLFKKYAVKYDFPYLMLMALAYQESGLDQSRRSHVGALGIMQVLPSTAKDKNVGVSKINKIENNIHAGTKYLRFMSDRYFNDDSIDSLNRNLLAIASYNAGPAKINRLRKEAKERGLDPNVWFNNVEVMAARRIGRETVQYVGNIYKYYIAYNYIVKKEKMKEVGKSILKENFK